MIKEYQSVVRYFAAVEDSMVATANRVRHLLGPEHWQSDGTYKEALVRKAVGEILPGTLKVGHGFILVPPLQMNDPDKCQASPQLDVIVYDDRVVPPVFRDGDFVIILASTAIAAIEVKSKWHSTGNEVRKTIRTLKRAVNMHLSVKHVERRYLFTAALAFENDFFPKVKGEFQRDDGSRFAEAVNRIHVEHHGAIELADLVQGNWMRKLGPVVPDLFCAMDTPWIVVPNWFHLNIKSICYSVPVLGRVNAQVGLAESRVNHAFHLLLSALQNHAIEATGIAHHSAAADLDRRMVGFINAPGIYRFLDPPLPFLPREPPLADVLPDEAFIPS